MGDWKASSIQQPCVFVNWLSYATIDISRLNTNVFEVGCISGGCQGRADQDIVHECGHVESVQVVAIVRSANCEWLKERNDLSFLYFRKSIERIFSRVYKGRLLAVLQNA